MKLEKLLVNFLNKKVLITGGTGLIGRQVVKILADAGAKVKVVSLDKLNVDYVKWFSNLQEQHPKDH